MNNLWGNIQAGSNRFIEDKEGKIWIATDNGLVIYNPKTKKYAEFTSDDKSSFDFPDDYFHSLFLDRSGVIWAATLNAGLIKIIPQKYPFKNYQIPFGSSQFTASEDVLSIVEIPNGDIIIGTDGFGLFKLSLETNKFTKIELINEFKGKDPLYFNELFIDTKNSLWIGAGHNDGGLFHFQLNTRKYIHYYADQFDTLSYKLGQMISGNSILSLLENSENNIWIGTQYCGISVLNLQDNSFKRFLHYENSNSLSNNYVLCLYETQDSTIWIGTDFGLNRFNSKSESFNRYFHNPNNKNSISANQISSLYEFPKDTLWVATLTGGLNQFLTKDNKFIRYTKNEGFPTNTIYKILGEYKKELWITTDIGLVAFDILTHETRVFSVEDGMFTTTFFRDSGYNNKKGRFYIGAHKGFISFEPNELRENTFNKPPILTDFYIGNRPVNLDSTVSLKTQIMLNHDENNFKFEFQSTNYRYKSKKYQYQLVGLEDDWSLPTDQNLVSYFNLHPGNYQFRTMDCTEKISEKNKVRSINLTIHPPFWQTIWAYVSYIFIIVGSISLGWSYQIRRIKRKAEMQKLRELDKEKSDFFANISHEFRTPISLLIGPIERHIKDLEDGPVKADFEIVYRNAIRIQRLINQLLDLTHLESGKLTPVKHVFDIVELINICVQSFESLAVIKKTELTFLNKEHSIPVLLDPEKMETVLYNLISNALKFTPSGGKVHISISKSPNKNEIIFSIKDSGPGIPEEHISKIFLRGYQVDETAIRQHEGSGIGLAITKKIIEIHDGQIFVESEVGKGTAFKIILPIGDIKMQKNQSIADLLSINCFAPTQTQNIQHADDRKQDQPVLLIVEDNADLQTFIKSIFKSTYNIIQAENGLAGYEKAIENIPDLIISDVMMPHMNGFEMCTKLREDERTNHIPIIMLTARATEQDKMKGLEIGVDDYLHKPFKAAEIMLRVKNLIEQRNRLRERFGQLSLLKNGNKDLQPADSKFLKKVIEAIEDILDSDPDHFSVESIVVQLPLSRSQLHRKLKAITNMSTSEFINNYRLEKASDLLKNKVDSIGQIAYMLGFESPSHFSALFRKKYSVTPTQYQNSDF